MSIRVMNNVWKNFPDGGDRLLLMLALADICDDEGMCFPGVPALARKLRKKERATQTTMRRLEADGHVRRLDQASKYGTNEYWLDRYADGGGAVHDTGGVQSTTPGGVQSAAPNSSFLLINDTEEVPIGTARRFAEAAPKPRTPRRDPWFEAVCSACRLDTAQMDEKMRLAVVGALSKLRGDTRVSLETLAAADARWWAGHFGRQGSAPTPAQFRTEVGRVLADEAAKAKTATNGRAAPSLAEILRNYPKSSYLEPSTWPAEARAAYPDMARQLEAAR